MKKFSKLLFVLLLCVCSIFASSCYLTNAQPMKRIKGTYQLTRSDRTEENFGEDGEKVSKLTNEIEEQGLEIYLIVTGKDVGYYAYKSATESGYIKEVALTYEADEQDKDKYAYVRFKDSKQKDFESYGVTRDSLNFSRPAVCTMFGKVELNQVGYNKRWEKVDKAIDVSYVTKKWGQVPYYTYEDWTMQNR